MRPTEPAAMYECISMKLIHHLLFLAAVYYDCDTVLK
jgi:hypothetical protein